MTEGLSLGIDGGGTGCRARLFDAGGRGIGEGTGGPANLLIGNGSGPLAELRAAALGALAAAGLDPAHLSGIPTGLGVAGATPLGRGRVFAAAHGFGPLCILSDSHAAALGAHGGADGGIVSLGTGAVACVTTGGAARDIGGWGFVLDDAGGGADLGRLALRSALREIDGGTPSAFGRAVLERFGGDPWAAVEWAGAAPPGGFGTLAPLVFAHAEEPEAAALIAGAAAEAERLVRLCHRHGATRVALLGSVGRRLLPHLRPEVALGLSEPIGDAADGAALAVRRRIGWTG